MGWADKYRQLMVYTNADTPRDAAQGRAFGAQGIGLCRTEHMFFEGDRIKAIREMIVADNTEDREKALAKIMPYQQGDFEGLYEAMEGCPVDRSLPGSPAARVRAHRGGGHRGARRAISASP